MPLQVQQFDNCSICVQPLEPRIKPKTLSILEPCGHKFHANPCFNTYILHLVEPALKKNVNLASLIHCPNCNSDVKYINEQISSQFLNAMKDKIHKN